MFKFELPESVETFRLFESLEILRETFDNLESPHFGRRMFKFQARCLNKYIYIRCRRCRNARFTYLKSKDNEFYEAKVFKNLHNHQLSTKDKTHFSRYIHDLPFGVEVSSARKIAELQFQVSSSQFYYAYSKYL